MKKLITLIISISVFAFMVNAKTVYVNATTGSDLNNGSTWAFALKTIPYALTVASTSGDNLWIAGGTYAIPGTSTFTQGNTNMYGGFSGNEGYLSSRPKSDLDGNGIVEPWEFTNATVLTFNVTDMSAITYTGAAFDGFTLSATATFNNNQNAVVYAMTVWTWGFANNTIKNNNLTFSANTASGGYYPFFRAYGTVNNCLFEKNTVTVNASQFAYINPFICVNSSYNITIGTKFLNSVIRNNKVTVDYSTAASGTNTYGVRGLIMSVAGGMNPTTATANTGGLPTTVANCVITNNEMVFIPGVASSPLSDGAVIGLNTAGSYNSIKQPTTDSIINCTVANNKGNRTNNCGMYMLSEATPSLSYHYVINNVFYNNQRAWNGTSYSVNNMVQNNALNAGLISNNFTDGGGLTNTTGQIVNQDNTLGTNLPKFKNPTITYGNTTDGTTELSNWSLNLGSYLIGKGIVTSRLKDKNGVSFATLPAVGAYEFVSNGPASQTISFSAISTKMYGVADFNPNATASSGLTVSYISSQPSVATIVSGQIHVVGAGSTIITASQVGNANYSAAANVTQTLIVNPIALTLTNPAATSKVYTGTNAAVITGTLTGIINSDAVSLIGTGTFASVNVANGISVTSTSILTGAKAGNYTLTQPTGLTANIYPVVSTWSGTSTWSNTSNWTYSPLSNTDVIVSGGELTIDQNVMVNSLTINPGAKLTLNVGKTLTAGTITLLSDATGTGTYLDNGTSTITTANVQQFLAGGRNWYISSPVFNANAATVLSSSTATTKPSSLVWYDETKGGTTSSWTTELSTLTNTKGYIAVNPINPNPASTDGVITFTGTLNTGDIATPTLSHSGTSYTGYNLIGNPFPSYLNAMTAINANSNLIPTIWYRTAMGSTPTYSFETVNTTSGVGTNILGTGPVTGYIPPMQAFWVCTNADNQTLTFSNAMRYHANPTVNSVSITTTPLKVHSQVQQQLVRLQVSNGVNNDEAVVYADPNASNAFDIYDSPKMSNSSAGLPEIYTTVENQNLVINGMNRITSDLELPLGFTTGQSNTFTIKASEISNFDASTKVILKDKLLNTEQDLTFGSAYSFTSDIASRSSRFSIVFKSTNLTTGNTTSTDDVSTVSIFRNANNQIIIHHNITSGEGTITVSNTVGQILVKRMTTGTTTVLNNYLAPGIYLVTVYTNGYKASEKLIVN